MRTETEKKPKHANVAFFVPHLGCPRRCIFCNQREIAGQTSVPSAAEVRATAGEALERMGGAARNAQIAFFGGSFTAINRSTMVSLLEAASGFVGENGFSGIRLSTRPDAIDNNILALLSRYGVTAIELGAQSMDDDVLAANRRGHTARDVVNASALIRRAGFELGLQMMTGLYADTPAGARTTAERIAELHPQTVRIYPTLVIKGTELEKLYRLGRYAPQTLDEAADLCAGLLEFFYLKGIRVIRLGLHASQSLEKSYVAGPMHPAFRELCESRIYHAKALNLLMNGRPSGGHATLLVNPSAVSKLAGQHRSNVLALERETGVKIKIEGSEKAGEYEILLRDHGR